MTNTSAIPRKATPITNSIMSYPDRGRWGNAQYRGNCSGYVIKDLLDTYQPKQFVDVFSGGGTGKDVAQELGYQHSIHLDLLNGWNALTDEVPNSDFIFSHPPYWDIIKYETQRHNYDPDDLSNVMSYPEFIAKLDCVNKKIYDSLSRGGHHAFLVGDVRKKGHYYSIIKDMTWFGDLESHIIKQQHHTVSGRKNYANSFIAINHEHLLVFKKSSIFNVSLKYTKDFIEYLRSMVSTTWKNLIRASLEYLGGQADLNQVYQLLDGCKKAETNSHWQAKIRQQLQDTTYFERIENGTYRLIAS